MLRCLIAAALYRRSNLTERPSHRVELQGSGGLFAPGQGSVRRASALSLCQTAVCVHSADSRTVGKRLAQAHGSNGFARPITTELLSLPLAMAEVQIEV